MRPELGIGQKHISCGVHLDLTLSACLAIQTYPISSYIVDFESGCDMLCIISNTCIRKRGVMYGLALDVDTSHMISFSMQKFQVISVSNLMGFQCKQRLKFFVFHLIFDQFQIIQERWNDIVLTWDSASAVVFCFAGTRQMSTLCCPIKSK